MIITVPDLDTTLIENNYLDVSTQDIKKLTLMDHMVNAESQERNPKG